MHSKTPEFPNVAPVITGHRPQYVTDGNLPANYAFSTVLEKIGERYKM